MSDSEDALWVLHESSGDYPHVVSNDHLTIHITATGTVSGSGLCFARYGDNYIVRPDQGTEYARKICAALNAAGVVLDVPPPDRLGARYACEHCGQRPPVFSDMRALHEFKQKHVCEEGDLP